MRLSVVLHGVPNFAEEDAVSDEDEDEPGSLEVGDDAFAWMIGPQNPKEFYSTCWEKKPLHVKRGDPTYYKDLFSSKGKLSVEDFFFLVKSTIHELCFTRTSVLTRSEIPYFLRG